MKTPSSFRLLGKFFIATLAASALAASANAQSLIGSVNGSNYTTGTWVSLATSNLGPWYISMPAGSETAIGDSATGGRTSIGADSFFINGSTTNSTEYLDAYLSLGGALGSGQSVSVSASYLWNGGVRGVEFSKAFGTSVGRFENIAGADPLNFNYGATTVQVAATAYQKAFTYTVTYVDLTTVNVSATYYGSPTKLLDQNVTVTDMPDQIKFYITGVTDSSPSYPNYGMYFNNIVTVPEPATYALLGLGFLVMGVQVIRRRKQA